MRPTPRTRAPRGTAAGAPRSPAARVAVGAALVTAAAMVLPWTVSGTVGRNAFATVGSAVRLGVVGDGPAAALVLLWYAVPFLAAAGLLALGLDRPAWGAVAAALAGLAAVGLAVGVRIAPIGTGVGAVVGGLAGAVAVVAGAVALPGARRPVAPVPTEAAP